MKSLLLLGSLSAALFLGACATSSDIGTPGLEVPEASNPAAAAGDQAAGAVDTGKNLAADTAKRAAVDTAKKAATDAATNTVGAGAVSAGNTAGSMGSALR